jgi:hypothetical protein
MAIDASICACALRHFLTRIQAEVAAQHNKPVMASRKLLESLVASGTSLHVIASCPVVPPMRPQIGEDSIPPNSGQLLPQKNLKPAA